MNIQIFETAIRGLIYIKTMQRNCHFNDLAWVLSLTSNKKQLPRS